MEVLLKPFTMSDHIKTFLDDPRWPEYTKDPQLKTNQEVNFFKYIIVLDFFSGELWLFLNLVLIVSS